PPRTPRAAAPPAGRNRAPRARSPGRSRPRTPPRSPRSRASGCPEARMEASTDAVGAGPRDPRGPMERSSPMRILLAGATGVIGRQAVPVLTAAGHQVTGMARTPARLPGVQMVAADALDPAAVQRAGLAAAPPAAGPPPHSTR